DDPRLHAAESRLGVSRGEQASAPHERTEALQRPVTANHAAPGGAVTKTIGAKHGDGSVTLVSSSPSPVAVAANASVTMFAVVAAPFVAVRQLTIALNCVNGFV